MTRLKDRLAPIGFAVLLFLGTTTTPATPVPFLICLAAVCIVAVVLVITTSMKKEAQKK